MSRTAFRWLSLVGVIWLQSVNGTNSNFPAYSSQLKQLLSISQVQLNNLAFASDAGKLFGFFSGIAAVHLPLWLVLTIGSFLGLIGYGVQFLFLTHQISSLSYWQVFLLTTLAGNSICWINTVCYVVTIRNFPSNPQLAVGLSTGYQGLSAKIYTDIVNAAIPFFHNNISRAEAYLFLSSVLPLLVSIIAAPFVGEINVEKGKRAKGGFVGMILITVGTGIFAVVSSLPSISSGLSPLDNAIGDGVSLLSLLVIPIAVKTKQTVFGKKKWIGSERRVYDFEMEEGGYGGRVEEGEKEEEEGERESRDLAAREEIGVKLMLKSVDFWLYFFVYITGATLGLVYLNNLGQIAESRGCSRTSSLVSLSSSFGFFGRLLPSFLDYIFSRSRMVGAFSRPATMAALTAPMCGAFFLLLSSTHASLFISTAVIGVCTGAITSLSVSLTTELFGAKNFSVNHNVLVANIPMGSFLFGFLAALLYRKEKNVGAGKCMGVECYRDTFIIWGSLCLLGTLLGLVLYARTRRFSQKL